MHRIIPIAAAKSICGTLSQTTKMPCKSNSLPTEACITGFRMAQMPGSICATCYANKGNYRQYENNIKPAQFARLDAINQACESSEYAELWVSGMVSMIGADEYFRWHDSGDIQSIHHLNLIVLVARATPNCKHWLPTREYGMVKEYIRVFGNDAIPENLIIRLSAMYPDQPVKIPASLANVRGIAVSNVHTGKPIGEACKAPTQSGECRDCRACWTTKTISYHLH